MDNIARTCVCQNYRALASVIHSQTDKYEICLSVSITCPMTCPKLANSVILTMVNQDQQ